MKLTIKDIAKLANVSITTVSRVLNNKQEGVGKKTRQRVQDVIDEHNYYPNAIARSMITKNTKTIGLIIPDIRNPFYSDILRGIEDVANENDYSVILCNVDSKFEKVINYIWLLSEKNVDGLIFAGAHEGLSKEMLSIVEENKLPLVIIDRGFEDELSHGVFIDNEKAAYEATKHLIELSHTKIGCITGPSNIRNSVNRLQGYLKAHTEAGLAVDQGLVKTGDYKMEGGYQAAKELLQQGELSAIFAFNDLMAFGVYEAAEELNIKIPQDLSVVGFDNLDYNRILRPKLTTVEQPIYQMGTVAVNLLLKQIERGDNTSDFESLFLETKLIVNKSTQQFVNYIS